MQYSVTAVELPLQDTASGSHLEFSDVNDRAEVPLTVERRTAAASQARSDSRHHQGHPELDQPSLTEHPLALHSVFSRGEGVTKVDSMIQGSR